MSTERALGALRCCLSMAPPRNARATIAATAVGVAYRTNPSPADPAYLSNDLSAEEPELVQRTRAAERTRSSAEHRTGRASWAVLPHRADPEPERTRPPTWYGGVIPVSPGAPGVQTNSGVPLPPRLPLPPLPLALVSFVLPPKSPLAVTIVPLRVVHVPPLRFALFRLATDGGTAGGADGPPASGCGATLLGLVVGWIFCFFQNAAIPQFARRPNEPERGGRPDDPSGAPNPNEPERIGNSIRNPGAGRGCFKNWTIPQLARQPNEPERGGRPDEPERRPNTNRPCLVGMWHRRGPPGAQEGARGLRSEHQGNARSPHPAPLLF